MNELKNQTSTPLPKSDGLKSEVASLNNLLGMLNNPALTGAEVPPEAKEAVRVPVSKPHPNMRCTPAPNAVGPSLALAPIASTETAIPEKVRLRVTRKPLTRIFFTGVMGVGKDYVANAAGAQTLGLADPIYHLVNVLFPGLLVSATHGKDISGVRELMQTLGQWGRGDINAKYPLTPARAMMLSYIQQLAKSGVFSPDVCVDWADYGVNQDIWVNSLITRAAKLDAGRRVAVTNVRFENEFKRLQTEGWVHCHVMCSVPTRQERLKKIGTNPNSPALTDTSERLALALDTDVAKKIKASGNPLRVVWNDSVPSPSPRVYTLNQWLQEVAIGEVPLPEETPAQQPMNLE